MDVEPIYQRIPHFTLAGARAKLILLLLTFSFSHITTAQNQPISVHRLTGPIVFDGKMDESAWQQVPPFSYKTQSPQFGKDPSEKYDVRMAYDDEYIYLAGRFDYSDASLVRGTTYKRDAFDATTEMFGMIMDTYSRKTRWAFLLLRPECVGTGRYGMTPKAGRILHPSL